MGNSITVFKNGVVSKIKNKRISVIRVKPKGKFEAPNRILFRSLTSDTGKKTGARSIFSKNKKVKETFLGLSDEALYTLYISIQEYFKEVDYNQE